MTSTCLPHFGKLVPQCTRVGRSSYESPQTPFQGRHSDHLHVTTSPVVPQQPLTVRLVIEGNWFVYSITIPRSRLLLRLDDWVFDTSLPVRQAIFGSGQVYRRMIDVLISQLHTRRVATSESTLE
jgi:hypothetical protein